MNDIWFEPPVTPDDLLAFARALSLEGRTGTPFLAILGGDDGAGRLVAGSQTLFALFDASSPEALTGRLMRGNDPGARRLSILMRTLTPEGAPRLERLRFFLGPGSEIITFLCRRVTVRDRTVFLAAALGIREDLIAAAGPRDQPGPAMEPDPALPALDPHAPFDTPMAISEPIIISDALPMPPATPPTDPERDARPTITRQETARRPIPPQTVAALQARLGARWPSARKLRFLWQTDADAICTLITPPLADVVGRGTADLAGRNLLDLAPQLDPTGSFAEQLAGRQTWSGLDLRWPITDEAATIAVTTGAIPVFDGDRTFMGFRGFGVIHLDRLSDALPTTFAQPGTTPADTNVLPFPALMPKLTADEEDAFQAIGAVLRDPAVRPAEHEVPSDAVEPVLSPPSVTPSTAASPDQKTIDPPAADEPAQSIVESAAAPPSAAALPSDLAALATTRKREIGRNGSAILDKLSLGLLVSRNNVPIFANRHLLDTLGFADEDALHEAGGMTHLFGGLPGNVTGSEAVGVRGRDGSILHANARMQVIDWDGLPATLLTLRPNGDPNQAGFEPKNPLATKATGSGARASDPARAAFVTPRENETPPASGADNKDDRRQRDDEIRELRAILETATDGVAVLDGAFTVISLNRSGEALLGRDRSDVIGKPFLTLFAPHNQSLAADYCEGLKSNATRSLLNDGREILVRAHPSGTIPVFMTLGRLGLSGLAPYAADTHEEARYCALFRDLTHWKKVEKELDQARTEAERTSALKSDFLAKVSHEIRTPLNAIIGFAEVIMDERFGPIGNARYKDYLKDIHNSGTHVMSLVNDLLDLSKIEAGKMELNVVAIDANKIITECVGIMHPQASQERVIMRLSLAATLPHIKADERSLRQIVLNLLSNAVKFNEPGGQVIIATALTDAGQIVIRIRDTGPGMSDTDIETALEPFRQLSTSRPMTAGTGLGLPLTKALVEANNASFTIRSKVAQGTLVEVAFPPAEALAH